MALNNPGGGSTAATSFVPPTVTIEAYNSATPIPISMSRDGKRLYSTKTGGYMSDDGGVTWKGPLFNAGLPVGYEPLTWLGEDGEGELHAFVAPVNGVGFIFRSSGYPAWNGSGVVGGGTVLTLSANYCRIIGEWAQSVVGEESIYAVAEYSPQGVGGRAYVTRDSGRSFTQCFDLRDYNGGVMPAGDHVHSITYDPHSGWLILVHGDQVNRIMGSPDFGATWHILHFRDTSDSIGQCVGVLPLPGSFLFSTDGQPSIRRWDRPLVMPNNPALAKQEVKVTGTPTGGNTTLSYGGQTSAAIGTTATASDVQTALAALSTIGAGKVVVTGTYPTFTVTLDSSLAPHKMISATPAFTGGSSPSVALRSVQTTCVNFHSHRLTSFGTSVGQYLAQGTYRARSVPGAPGIICSLPTNGNVTGKSVVLGTVDGKTFHTLFIDATAPGSDKGMSRFFGPDANGKYWGAWGGPSGLQRVSATAPVFPEAPMATR